MATVHREVWIDASPDVVREHVTDPAKRGTWVDGDLGDPRGDGPEGPVRFVRRADGADAEVEISFEPAGDGTLVRVVERVAPAGDGIAPDVPTALARAA